MTGISGEFVWAMTEMIDLNMPLVISVWLQKVEASVCQLQIILSQQQHFTMIPLAQAIKYAYICQFAFLNKTLWLAVVTYQSQNGEKIFSNWSM